MTGHATGHHPGGAPAGRLAEVGAGPLTAQPAAGDAAGAARPAPAGIPLILLHGGGPGVDAASNWATVLPALATRFRCLAPDLLGFGTRLTDAAGTERPRGPRAWARARARQVLDLLDREGLDRVHIVGNSAAGGAAALALIAEAPERVARAVLMGGAGTGPLPAAVPFYDRPTRESMRATLARLVADEDAHRELLDRLADLRLRQALRAGAEADFRAMFAADLGTAAGTGGGVGAGGADRAADGGVATAAGPGVATATAAGPGVATATPTATLTSTVRGPAADPATGLAAPPPLDLARAACPVLALHGEHDRVAPVAVSARLAAALPDARLRVVAGAGHWIHVDRPEEFLTLVEEFVSA